jgi:arsenite methyltransferase
MPDVYATIAEQDQAVQEQIAEVLELRAADRQQRAMLDDYLRDLELAPDARVLEIGCGTGAVCRVLATRPRVAEVTGVDPSIVLVQRARELAEGHGGLSFIVGDGVSCPSTPRVSMPWSVTRPSATSPNPSGCSRRPPA